MSDHNINNTRWPSPSATSVPEYQLSGLPFCKTKSINNTVDTFEFPRVTRWITISSNVAVDVYFTAAADEPNVDQPIADQYFTVPADTHILRLELRCSKIWVKTTVNATVSVIAGLTHIDSSKSVPESMLDWS